MSSAKLFWKLPEKTGMFDWVFQENYETLIAPAEKNS